MSTKKPKILKLYNSPLPQFSATVNFDKKNINSSIENTGEYREYREYREHFWRICTGRDNAVAHQRGQLSGMDVDKM